MFTDKVTPLRVCRFFQGKSIYVVGNEAGIDPARLSLIERSLKTPTPEEKENLSKALGVPIKEIFPPEHGDEQEAHHA